MLPLVLNIPLSVFHDFRIEYTNGGKTVDGCLRIGMRNRYIRGGTKEWSTAHCERRLIIMHATTRVMAWYGQSRIRIDYIDDKRIYKHLVGTCHLSAVNEMLKTNLRIISCGKVLHIVDLLIY